MAKYRERGPEDYLVILRRGKWVLVVPCLLIGLVAFWASFLLPDQYRSETLIMVERQQIPKEYVRPTITTVLQDRLQTMTQEILSRTRIQLIIGKFGLYKNYSERQFWPRLVALAKTGFAKLGVEEPGFLQRYRVQPSIEKLIGVMRENIDIQLVRRGGPEVTAFKVSYIGETPQIAQQVTTELTSLFIEENLKVRERMAENTSQFIDVELEAARKVLENQETKLREFKTRYIGQLPQQEQTNLQLLSHWQGQLQTNAQALNRLQQEEILLRNSLSVRETIVGAQAGAEGTKDSPFKLQQQLSNLRSDLSQLEARYTSQHPDVVKIKREISQIQTQLAEAAQEPEEKDTVVAIAPPPDPQIARFETQLDVNRMERERLQAGQGTIQKAIEDYRERIRRMPLREQQYLELTRDYTVAKKNYESLLNKQNLSSLARNLERRQQGEQFRILDPANLPAGPFRPNRPMFGLGGSLIGFMLGLGWVAGREVLDKSLRNERDVEFYLETPVVGLIPVFAPTKRKQLAALQSAGRNTGARAGLSVAR